MPGRLFAAHCTSAFTQSLYCCGLEKVIKCTQTDLNCAVCRNSVDFAPLQCGGKGCLYAGSGVVGEGVGVSEGDRP